MSLVFVALAKNLNTVVVDYKIINDKININNKVKETNNIFLLL